MTAASHWAIKWDLMPTGEQERRVAAVMAHAGLDVGAATLGALAGLARRHCSESDFKAELGRHATSAALVCEHWGNLKPELQIDGIWAWDEQGQPRLCPDSPYARALAKAAVQTMDAAGGPTMPPPMADALRALAGGTGTGSDVVVLVICRTSVGDISPAAVRMLDATVPYACAGLSESETRAVIEVVRSQLTALLATYEEARRDLAAADAWPWPTGPQTK